MTDPWLKLLLEVLELANPEITGRSLRRNLDARTDDILRSGILTPIAPGIPLPDPRWHDCDDLALENGWDAPLVGEATNSSLPEVPAADVGVYRIALDQLLRMLTDALELVAARSPIEVLAGHAWDIGDLWITRSRKVPMLFARRLHIEAIAIQLHAALQNRAGRSGGLILTSTSCHVTNAAWPASHQVVPLVNILSPVAQPFGLDVQLLKSFFAGHSPDGSSAGPVRLAADGRSLRINEDEFLFKGPVQVAIIRQLVKGFASGERPRTSDVLATAGSQADTLAKAFSGYRDWGRLKAYIKQERGFCWLEP